MVAERRTIKVSERAREACSTKVNNFIVVVIVAICGRKRVCYVQPSLCPTDDKQLLPTDIGEISYLFQCRFSSGKNQFAFIHTGWAISTEVTEPFHTRTDGEARHCGGLVVISMYLALGSLCRTSGSLVSPFLPRLPSGAVMSLMTLLSVRVHPSVQPDNLFR